MPVLTTKINASFIAYLSEDESEPPLRAYGFCDIDYKFWKFKINCYETSIKIRTGKSVCCDSIIVHCYE